MFNPLPPGEGWADIQKHFATLPLIFAHLHPHYLSLLLCYNIRCGDEMSTSFFSLSAPVRLLMALALIVFIGQAVCWAVALP
jgi:hypothetical protein